MRQQLTSLELPLPAHSRPTPFLDDRARERPFVRPFEDEGGIALGVLRSCGKVKIAFHI